MITWKHFFFDKLLKLLYINIKFTSGDNLSNMNHMINYLKHVTSESKLMDIFSRFIENDLVKFNPCHNVYLAQQYTKT